MATTEEGITLLMEDEPPEAPAQQRRRERALTHTERLRQSLTLGSSPSRRGGDDPPVARTLSGQGRELVRENRRSAGQSDDVSLSVPLCLSVSLSVSLSLSSTGSSGQARQRAAEDPCRQLERRQRRASH